MTDIFSKKQRSQLMSKIRSKNTGIEIKLRKSLWENKMRGYKLYYNEIGKPDIVYTKKKITIFCDGDFWHGRKFNSWGKDLKPFWYEKINKNIQRDRKVSRILRKNGWTVIRFWGSQIENDIDVCTKKIEMELIKNRRV